jgi:hypothetical protein
MTAVVYHRKKIAGVVMLENPMHPYTSLSTEFISQHLRVGLAILEVIRPDQR